MIYKYQGKQDLDGEFARKCRNILIDSKIRERVRYRREKEEKRKNERNCELCGNLSGLIGWICRRMCVVCVSLDRFMKPSDLYLDQEFNFLSENVFMESWV